ncbi:DUF349 domain-containing protein [Wenzhouxiangella sp. XN79A]|uniref:DUF349 domain-containing protein n=1 Tax=Wenzhouxiangella sp. XN79A TaxID=2724193 RepID=UPI00144A8F4F|nr:DUF349 domain-containing protein [Wenzhouxiangella sp. XN79A]NKI34093.1 DUF349 domain-containing protein [Wenzhouxiangella sp. XN79A]
MSLKERLFGMPWEHKNAEERVLAITGSTDPRLREALPGLATGDPDPHVRLAALKRMDDENAWRTACRDDRDGKVREAAHRSVLHWITTAPRPDAVDARREWLRGVDDAALIKRVAESARDVELRRDALVRIGAQGYLGDRFCEEPDDEVADEILARIDQASTLKRVAERLRTRHKQRHQAVLERLGSLADDGGRATRESRARELVDGIEQLARGQYSGDREARADELQARWAEIEEPEPALQRRFEGALQIVRRALRPRPEPRETAESPSANTRAASPLEQAVEALRTLAAQPVGDDTAQRLRERVAEFELAWKAMSDPDEAARKQAQHFNALADELRARLAPAAAPATKEKDGKPAPSGPDPALIEALETALETAERALDGGEIPTASEAVNAARSAHDRIPKRHRPTEAAGRLTRMSGRLKEMRDWQHWSNNKLRERLIERAEAIDPAELHPDAITERLKELRERWRQLDAQELLPDEKRRFAAPHAQWRRFQAACKQAFEGAKPYLEKRSEVREESLGELKAFLDDAERLVDDEAADRDALVRHQRAARQVIRNLEQVPPKSRGRMAKRLKALMDRISARLDAASEAVEQEKRRLVAEARKLAHEKDRTVAIDRAKALQAAWKQAGRGRRKVEDALWKEFREPIDPLFEGLKKERDEQREKDRAAIDELKALCERAEALVNAGDDELEAAAGPLAGLEDEFGQHGRVPPALRKRMDAAIKTYRRRMNELAEAREQAARAHLDALAEALQQAWAAIAGGQAAAPDRPDVPADDPLGQQMNDRLEAFLAPGAKPDVLADEVRRGTDRARQVCVEMECLTGLESPAADKNLRMDYQLSRLSSRLGEGAARPDIDAERAELLRRWLGSFPHDPAAHAALAERYRAADRILKQMSAS